MPTQTTAPLTQFTPQGTPSYLTRNGGSSGAYVQSVDPSSLMSHQLAGLMRSDNPIVQAAAQGAQANALARGGGVSGTQAIDASNRAMFDILNPVAAQDAGQYASVDAANQDALNQQNLTGMNNRTNLTIAAGNQSVERGRNREMSREFDVQQSNRAQDRQWSLADQASSARANARSQFFGNMEGAVFSNPDFWSDPQGAMGMFNTFGSNFDSWFTNQFPEYAQDTATNGSSP